jgi:hypothetical protein
LVRDPEFKIVESCQNGSFGSQAVPLARGGSAHLGFGIGLLFRKRRTSGFDVGLGSWAVR